MSGETRAITVHDDEETEPQQDVKLIHAKILNASYLVRNQYQDEFQELLQKQRRSCLTEQEHFQILKHFIKLRSGLDILTIEIIQKFRYADIVANFACLIDLTNETTKDELMRSERITKHAYILHVINRLGFNGIYDDILIHRDDFTNKMTTTILYLFNQFKINKKFNMLMNDSKHKIKDMLEAKFKAQLYYINSLVRKYSIKISVVQKTEKGFSKKVNYYKVSFLDSIDELLEYKIRKGYTLKDSKNMFIKPSSIDGFEFKYAELFSKDGQRSNNNSDGSSQEHTLDTKSLDSLIPQDTEEATSTHDDMVKKKTIKKKRSRFELFGDTPF
jgi:hypothetical protein